MYFDVDQRVVLHSGSSDESSGGHLIHVDARTMRDGPALVAWINNITGEKFVMQIGERSYDEAAVEAIHLAVEHAPVHSHVTLYCSCRRLMRYRQYELYTELSFLREVRDIDLDFVFIPPSQNLATKLLRSKRVAAILGGQ